MCVLHMYAGIGNPENRLLKFLPTRLAAATRRDTTAVGFERQIAEQKRRRSTVLPKEECPWAAAHSGMRI